MIGFIGFGKMGSALGKAMEMKGHKLLIADPAIEDSLSNKEVAGKAEIIFLCVKPNNAKEVLEEIRNKLNGKILVSIIAGMKIERIKEMLNSENAKIVRVMPNVSCLVHEMAAGFSCINLSSEEEDQIANLLDCCGTPIKVNENMLDAVTALSGSGPAFIARIIQYYLEAGEEIGLNKNEAEKLGLQTVYGTIKLLKQGFKPGQIVEMVSSPNGTTVAGRKVLENSEIKDVLKETLKAAYERSIELGKN